MGGLLERETTRYEPEWAAAMASLTVSENIRIKPSRRQHKENERDCRTVVKPLVSSISENILMRTSYRQKEKDIGTQRKTVTFEDPDQKLGEVEQNQGQKSLSGEIDVEKGYRVNEQHPEHEILSAESELKKWSCRETRPGG